MRILRTGARVASLVALMAGSAAVTTAPGTANAVPAGLEPATVGPTVTFGGGGLEAVTPSRILDTRTGLGAPDRPVAGGEVIELDVTGVAGLPVTGVGAVVLNVTAVSPSAAGWVTVWPTGAARPLASNLNLRRGETVPNLVVVKVGRGGKVNLFVSSGSTDLLADVAGWFPEGPAIEPLVPARLLDTRNATGAPKARVGPNGVVHLQVTGRGGVPSTGVGAVVLNVTAVSPTASSFVTVWPQGSARPLASNLNLTPNVTAPNLVVAKVGSTGKVSLFNASGSTDLVADVAAWIPKTSPYVPLTPARILDTRTGQGAPKAPVGPKGQISVTVIGVGGVPATGVGAVVVNVTAVAPSASSFVTVWPGSTPKPLASNLNLIKGRTDPNLVIVKVGADGMIRLANDAGSTHLVADVAGWFPSAPEDTTSYVLHEDTVVAGPGDLLSTTGDPETGGTAVLAPSADIPAVGGKLAAFPSAAIPSGFSGVVTSVSPGPGAATSVALAPVDLQDVFADLDVQHHGPVDAVPARAARAAALARTPTALGVAGLTPSCSGSLPFAPTFSLESWNADFEFDLSGAAFRMAVGVTPTMTWAGTVTGAFSCSLEMPVPVIIPVAMFTLETSLYGTVGVSASASSGVSIAVGAPITIGVSHIGGTTENLSDLSVNGTADLEPDAEVELSATLELGAAIDGKVLGIAGLSISFGMQFEATKSPAALPCAVVTLGPVISLSAEVGRWGIEWVWQIASFEGPKVTLYEQVVGCPNEDLEWRGSIDVQSSRTMISPGRTITETGTGAYDVLGRAPSSTSDYLVSAELSGEESDTMECNGGSATRTYSSSLSGTTNANGDPMTVLLIDSAQGTSFMGVWQVAVVSYSAFCGGDAGQVIASLDEVCYESGMCSFGRELDDDDPDPLRLVGTTTFTLANPPYELNFEYTAYSYTVTYDLTKVSADPPP